jgi:MFS superfamily sulfate permease-like transporter
VNRWILYFISILAITDFLYLANTGDWASVMTFVIVAFLVTFFNKNMIVVFSISMAITNLLKYGIKANRVHEGFDNSSESDLENDAVVKAEDDNVKIVDNEKPIIDKTGGKNAEKKTEKTKKEKMKELTKDFPEFKEIQKEVLGNIAKLDPLLKKAENFIEKFNDYKSS